MTKRPESAGWGARAASGVIVLVLGLQALTAFGLTPGPIEHSPYLWPFLEYPMYSKAHFVGEEVPRYQVVAVTADGTELTVTPESLGTDFWIYRNAFLFPFLYAGRRADFEPGVGMFERRHEVSIVEVRLEDRPLVLSSDGVREGAPVTVGRARREEGGAAWTWEER